VLVVPKQTSTPEVVATRREMPWGRMFVVSCSSDKARASLPLLRARLLGRRAA
jgi:hypothetical protein